MGKRPSGVIGFVLLTCACLAAHVAGADKRIARDHYKRGMAHFVMERWDEAIREFDSGFTEEPLPEFLYNIAQAHRKAGRPAQAISFYKKYLQLIPEKAPDRRQVELEMEAAKEELAATPSPPPSPVPTIEAPKPPPAAAPAPRITIERVPQPPPPVAPPPPAPVETVRPPVATPTLVASSEKAPPPPSAAEASPFVETTTTPIEKAPSAPATAPSHRGSRLQGVGLALFVVGAGIAVGGGLGFHYLSQSASDQIVDQGNRGVRYDPSLGEAMSRDQTLSIAAYAAGGAIAVAGAIFLVDGLLVKSREAKKNPFSLGPAVTPRSAGLALSGAF